MKKIAIIFSLLVASMTFVYSQTASDTITMQKVFGGYQFYHGGNRLTMNQLVNTMKSNEQAYEQMKSAQSANTLATIVGGAAGFMIGWPLGAAVGGGEPNWVMAGIGAGLIVAAIPINKNFNKKAKKAVDTYNNSLEASSASDRGGLKFSLTGNGVGLVFRF